jgi:hypothetical protein
MAKRRRGVRFPLLMYRQAIAPYRWPLTLLASLLLILGLLMLAEAVAWPPASTGVWPLAGGGLLALASLFVWAAPGMAVVQPRHDHLRISTPFFRLRISYRRLVATRPVDLVRVFPPADLSKAHRRLLEPFYGATALGIELNGFPLPNWMLQLFLHPLIFAPDQPGLILIVADWMALSSQLTSLVDAWRADQRARQGERVSHAAQVLGLDRKRKRR